MRLGRSRTRDPRAEALALLASGDHAAVLESPPPYADLADRMREAPPPGGYGPGASMSPMEAERALRGRGGASVSPTEAARYGLDSWDGPSPPRSAGPYGAAMSDSERERLLRASGGASISPAERARYGLR